MIRAVVGLALVLGSATALAEAPTPPPVATSIEVAWLRDFASFASSAGPYGVVAGLIWLLRFVWQENKAKDTTIGTLRKQIDDIQEKRVGEGVASAERITKVATESTATISENIKTSAETTSILRALSEKTAGIVPLLSDVSQKVDRNLAEYRDLHKRGAE